MTVLVADVGGTNSRLALATDGKLDPTTIRRFRNAEYQSFYNVVEDYQHKQSIGPVTSCTVAMAGPVTSQRAKLTNLDWEISAVDLKRVTSCQHALLMNDLTALGHSIGHLPPKSFNTVTKAVPDAPTNDQFLVAGLGTGFNVCPVKKVGTSNAVCLEAELGHIAPPLAVVQVLEAQFSQGMDRFQSIEDCFSGRGLSQIYGLLTGQEQVDAAAIVTNHVSGTDQHATQALELLADLLGALAREMALQYLPLNGLYFAGSVARGLFDAGFGPVFQTSFSKHMRFGSQLRHLPVFVITDDAAALIGCVAASR